MSGRYLICLTLLALTSFCAGDHSFNCPSQPLCSGQIFSAICSDVPVDSMSWQLLDSNGNSIDSLSSEDYYNTTNSSLLGTISYGGVDIWFNQESNISISANFTASPALDGYWLICTAVKGNMSFDLNCSIDVNTVTMPQNVSLDFPTITNTSIVANWTSWPDDCLQNYLINITTDSGSWWNYTIPRTQMNYTIWARPNYTASTTYRLTITPIGYNGPNRNRTAAARPIIFDVPPAVTNLRATYMPILQTTPDMTPINVTIRWNAAFTFRPRNRGYYIRHNATRHLQMPSSGSGSGMDSDDNSTPFVTRFIPVPRGQMVNMARLTMGARVGDTYMVYIIANNILGNSTAAYTSFTLQYQPTPTPTPTPSTTTPTSTSTMDMTMSPTVGATETSGLATWAIAVIAVVAGIVLAAIVAVVIVVLIVVFCICSSAAKKQEEHEMTEGTKL